MCVHIYTHTCNLHIYTYCTYCNCMYTYRYVRHVCEDREKQVSKFNCGAEASGCVSGCRRQVWPRRLCVGNVGSAGSVDSKDVPEAQQDFVDSFRTRRGAAAFVFGWSPETWGLFWNSSRSQVKILPTAAFGAGDQNSVTWGSGPRISSKRICRWPGAVVESARVPLRLSIEAMV